MRLVKHSFLVGAIIAGVSFSLHAEAKDWREEEVKNAISLQDNDDEYWTRVMQGVNEMSVPSSPSSPTPVPPTMSPPSTQPPVEEPPTGEVCDPPPGLNGCLPDSSCIPAPDGNRYCVPLNCLWEKSREFVVAQDVVEQFNLLGNALRNINFLSLLNPLNTDEERAEILAEATRGIIDQDVVERWESLASDCFGSQNEGNRALQNGFSFIVGAAAEGGALVSGTVSLFGAIGSGGIGGYGQFCTSRGVSPNLELGIEPVLGFTLTSVDNISGRSTVFEADIALGTFEFSVAAGFAPDPSTPPRTFSLTFGTLVGLGIGGGVVRLRCNTAGIST